MDADMILETGPAFDKRCCTLCISGVSNNIIQECYNCKNNIGIKYWGVTHEVIETPPNSVYSGIGKELLFINDVGDGGAKADKCAD